MEGKDMGMNEGSQGAWDDVGDEVVAAILEKLKPALKKASETIYEDLLYTAQDYLIDNVRWNIRSEIESNKRQALGDRQQLTLQIRKNEELMTALQMIVRQKQTCSSDEVEAWYLQDIARRAIEAAS